MNFEESKQWHERACRVIPGGVNSNVRLISEPAPLFYSHAKDARIWDVDGNEYIDYVLGQGPMLLGHTPEPVLEAVRQQLDKGLCYGGQTELEVRAAELMVEHIPCAEQVRFNNTGSEAVHAALRLARAATGRKKILRFEGHYHGWFDTIAWNSCAYGMALGPREAPSWRPSTKGQTSEDAANLMVCPWNESQIVEAYFAEQGDEIAGVICDPFACACGIIPAEKAFLQHLHDLCSKNGSVLIFDEVITGLRVAPGGAQAHYGITPDLATFAKALGGGLAVSAIAGKEELMRPLGTGRVVHSGTYNANPLAMAGTVAALEMIFADNGAELAKAHNAGRRLKEGLQQTAQSMGIPMQFRGVPAVFSTSFVPENAPPITDMRSADIADRDKLRRFWAGLHHAGVQMTSFGIWFVSTAHTDTDIDETIAAARSVLEDMSRETP
jgi:glutamate-1-semialdehyde 2,1-aminomutase